MTQFDSLYGSKYLSASEFDKPRTMTIKNVDIATFDKPGEPTKKKALVSFVDEDKGLVLNVTNARSLAQAFGKNFGDWVGNQVELRRETTNFAGKAVDGLRVYPARSMKPAAREEFDDAIPF